MGSRITRTGRGGEGKICPPANSAPMNARITNFLWEVGWLKISVMCDFGDPRSISWGNKKSNLKKKPKFCEKADLRAFSSGRKTIIGRNDS